MRVLGYYIGHTFVNILRKLFKTWIMIFLVVCLAFGAIIGLGMGFLMDAIDSADESQNAYESQVDHPQADPSQNPAQDPAGEPGQAPEAEDEIQVNLSLPEGVTVPMLVEAGFGALLLLWLLVASYGADKTMGTIFQPGDIQTLFTSPMKPQSVLMFRLVTAMGMSLAASLYLVFQLPNLILNLGLGLWTALSLLLAWALFLMMVTLWKCFLFVFGSEHPLFKKMIQPAVFAVPILVVGLVALRIHRGRSVLQALTDVLASPYSRIVPLWGWVKTIPMWVMEENYLNLALFALACVAGMAALAAVIWRTRVDFYEEAMIRTEEMAELKKAAQEASRKGKLFVSTKKKDRSEKISRDGFTRGWGADVFFWKTLYNRRRFATAGFLTKPMILYLVVAGLLVLFLRLVVQAEVFQVIPTGLALVTFFRSMGSSLQEDTSVELFRTAPPSHFSKLCYSALGAVTGNALDVLPGLVLGTILLKGGPLEALAWLLVIASVNFYAISTGNFIGLAAPSAAGKNLRAVFQVMFMYFGLLPDIALIAVGFIFGPPALFILMAAIVNVGLGFLFLFLARDFMANR